jgi:hypothetical protein
VWPAGSGAVSIWPPASRALTCEAKRRVPLRLAVARAGGRVVQRFDAERVARQQQGLFAGIPQGKGIHAAQVLQHGRAFGLVQVQQYLRVGFAAEDVALRFELAAQFAVVVDFAVEGDDELAVCALHRLCAALGEVDDGQAAVAEGDAAVVGEPFAMAVWAAGGHVVADGAQLCPVRRGGGGGEGVEAGYGAHGLWFRRLKTWIAALRSQ